MYITVKAKKNSDNQIKLYKIPSDKIDWIEVDNETSTLAVGNNTFFTSLKEDELDDLLYFTDDSDEDVNGKEYFDPFDEPIKVFKGETMQVGKHRFRVDVCQFNLVDISNLMVVIKTNFLLKENDYLVTLIENIEGVEGLDFMNDSDYETNINIGEMFDIEDVRSRIQEKIKENLEE